MGFVVPASDEGRATFADEAAELLGRLLDAAVAVSDTPDSEPFIGATALAADTDGMRPTPLHREIAEIVEAAGQVGEGLAAVHFALVRPGGPPPAPYTSIDRRALYQGVRTRMSEAITALRERGARRDGSLTDRLAEAVIAGGPALDSRLRLLLGPADRRATHPTLRGPTDGLPGPPGGRAACGRRPGSRLPPRRGSYRLHSPLVDIAAILASLRAIALRPLFGGDTASDLRPWDASRTEAWARAWWATVAASFVAAYLAALPRPALVPSTLRTARCSSTSSSPSFPSTEIVALARVGLPPDPSALVALLDLAGAPCQRPVRDAVRARSPVRGGA